MRCLVLMHNTSLSFGSVIIVCCRMHFLFCKDDAGRTRLIRDKNQCGLVLSYDCWRSQNINGSQKALY